MISDLFCVINITPFAFASFRSSPPRDLLLPYRTTLVTRSRDHTRTTAPLQCVLCLPSATTQSEERAKSGSKACRVFERFNPKMPKTGKTEVVACCDAGSRGTKVRCEFCAKSWHTKCANISANALKTLRDTGGACWLCPTCRSTDGRQHASGDTNKLILQRVTSAFIYLFIHRLHLKCSGCINLKLTLTYSNFKHIFGHNIIKKLTDFIKFTETNIKRVMITVVKQMPRNPQ